tara:strand:+ start:6099 stop:6317 length:219 start_codon:yes stop_codon:yes gene_type:complete
MNVFLYKILTIAFKKTDATTNTNDKHSHSGFFVRKTNFCIRNVQRREPLLNAKRYIGVGTSSPPSKYPPVLG